MKGNLVLGLIAAIFYLIHATVHVIDGTIVDLLWACNLGCLIVALGMIFNRPWMFSIGFFWLTLGLPLWILDISTGGEYMPTSTLIHIGGPTIGLLGCRYIRLPRYSWAAAVGGLFILGAISRVFTAPQGNINIAFAVWPGWEKYFPSYFWYALMLLAIAGLGFFTVDTIIRKVFAIQKDLAWPGPGEP